MHHLPMLKRSQSTFIIPSGVKHTFSIVDAPRDVIFPSKYGLPAQVIVTYGAKKRAFGRERLLQFDYYQALALLDREFGVVRPSQDEGMEATFHRPGGYDTSLVTIDHDSWRELLLSVTKIELKKPKSLLSFYQHHILYGVILAVFVVYLCASM